jgi:hypothetical protein
VLAAFSCVLFAEPNAEQGFYRWKKKEEMRENNSHLQRLNYGTYAVGSSLLENKSYYFINC